MPKSWRTTVYGIALILAAVANAAVALLDGDASTQVDWNSTWVAIMGGFGLLSARDQKAHEKEINSKSS